MYSGSKSVEGFCPCFRMTLPATRASRWASKASKVTVLGAGVSAARSTMVTEPWGVGAVLIALARLPLVGGEDIPPVGGEGDVVRLDPGG